MIKTFTDYKIFESNKKLENIIKRYSHIEYDNNNYEIGGGLSTGKFSSRRHEAAKEDKGKITLGKACQMFKNATGHDLNFIKELINNVIPYMEWHHAGKLPKSYGGGMKKTYFLNSEQIVDLANNWDKYVNDLNISHDKKKKEQEQQNNKNLLKMKFLKKYATQEFRLSKKPKYFYETNREMNGKHGWFNSYNKRYNLPEYYTGWVFRSQRKLDEFLEKFN